MHRQPGSLHHRIRPAYPNQMPPSRHVRPALRYWLPIGLLALPGCGQEARSPAVIRTAEPATEIAELPSTDDERIRALESYVRRLADADSFSGVVLLAEQERPLLAEAYGDADKVTGRANELETAFNLASLNKMITAVAVAQLVEAGKLSFEDPLAKYLPDFPNPRAAAEIRVKHLLSHTAGLGSYLGPEISASRAATVDEMLRFASDTDTDFAPGTGWRYSNTGFLVLGKVIERVSGQSYFDFVREHIYIPAGMRNTGSYAKDALPQNAAIGYEPDPGDGPGAYIDHLDALPYRGGPAGGGYSTAPDLLRFAEALRTGKLVSPEMVGVLTSPKPELSSPQYGYGFMVNPRQGLVGHNGGFQGTSAFLGIFPENGHTIIILSNYGRSGMPIFERLRTFVRGPESQ